jgi:hypothetical protein
MDFMFDLPVTSSGKSGIAVIVDKLSRQAHFLNLSPKFDAVYLAHLYPHEVYRHHGLPRVLISDRDVRFTSLFWTALMKRLGVKLVMPWHGWILRGIVSWLTLGLFLVFDWLVLVIGYIHILVS